MAAGAGAIALSSVSKDEHVRWREAAQREGRRYGVDSSYVDAGLSGRDATPAEKRGRSWVDWVLVTGATAIFVRLALFARTPNLELSFTAMTGLCAAMVLLLAGTGVALWRITRFN